METKYPIERAVIRGLSREGLPRRSDTTGQLDRAPIESRPAPMGELLKQLWRLGDKRRRETRSADIHQALSRLQDEGLVKEIEDSPSSWGLTEDGTQEAEKLREEFEEKLEDLVKRYGGDWVNDPVSRRAKWWVEGEMREI